MSMRTTITIVGTQYRPGAAALLARYNGKLKERPVCIPVMALKREPENPHDRNAVVIYAADLDDSTRCHHVGYVPRTDSRAVAKVMDAGVSIRAVYKGSSTVELFWPAATKEGVDEAYRRAMKEAEGI